MILKAMFIIKNDYEFISTYIGRSAMGRDQEILSIAFKAIITLMLANIQPATSPHIRYPLPSYRTSPTFHRRPPPIS
jgi:hypothetical protein